MGSRLKLYSFILEAHLAALMELSDIEDVTNALPFRPGKVDIVFSFDFGYIYIYFFLQQFFLQYLN